ncbi:MAG: alpha/beta fold hydrolase [Candidatus Binatia bacterium]
MQASSRLPDPSVCLAPTSDRWGLALHRYPNADPDAPAAILCSGYGCNRHFVDFDEHYSLARHLARDGFDTWVIELRGRGMSQPLRGCQNANRWTFDDFVTTDVPTVIRFVQQQLGHRRICWIGHSMGGMVMYAYLGLARDDAVPAAAVSLATPIGFPRVASDLAHGLGKLLLSIPISARVPQRPVIGALWHLVGWTRALEVGMNPDNIDRHTVGTALRKSMSNVSREKLLQLAHWSATGTFSSVDGTVDYRRNLARIRTPMLVVAGANDRLAPPEIAGTGYDQIASPIKRMVVLGRSEGFDADYGHVDIIFGRQAPAEVFPLIAEWARETLAEVDV